MFSYRQAIDTLYRLQWIGRKFGLDNIQFILKALHQPHRRFKTIHISGTNGKGSTASILASLLKEHGICVGLYTSPHLVDFSERIRVNGEPIPHEEVARLTHKISQLISDQPDLEVTFFEFTTAMAFDYFSEREVEMAVVEVGMGGRLDATNVVEPMVSVITNIDLDHESFLGHSVEKITFEKAGIIKSMAPTVTGARSKEAIDVIEKVCKERQSVLSRIGEDFEIEEEANGKFSYRGIKQRWSSLSLNLKGRHQLENAACALSVLEILSDKGIEISEESIRTALRRVRWEGRLESIQIEDGPLVLLDGAHNPGGARALRAFLSDFMKGRDGKLILILGTMKDKNIKSIFGELFPLAEKVILTRPDYHRAATLGELESVSQSLGRQVRIRESVDKALQLAQKEARPADCICVTGSLFTVGEARAILCQSGAPSVLKG